MKLKEFKYEIKERKKQLLFDNGVYLTYRQQGDYFVFLYQLGSFYVEAYFYEGYEDVSYIRAFSSLKNLDPYLKDIDITGLF